MPKTTQIVPKWTYPHVESYINDYTAVTDDTVTASEDNYVVQPYAVRSYKGIDNVWVRKSSRESAVGTFGESNFKLYGQPLLQALNVSGLDNSSAYIMRVMPEAATYSSRTVIAFYKENIQKKNVGLPKEVVDPVASSFDIVLVAFDVGAEISSDPINAIKEKAEYIKDTLIGNGIDVAGYTPVPFFNAYSYGRGVSGDNYSIRVQSDKIYEKSFGIKIYNFEIDSKESGLTQIANYVGAIVTSPKYYDDGITLINDVLDEAETGVAPVNINVDEDAVESIYDAYVGFLDDVIVDYDKIVDAYVAAPDDNPLKAELKELIDHADVIKSDKESGNIIAVDEFDVFYGVRVGTDSDKLDNINVLSEIPENLETAIDGVMDVYGDGDGDRTFLYTSYTHEFADFAGVSGVGLMNGSDNGFVHQTDKDGVQTIKRPYEYEDDITDEELADLYVKAYNGTYDASILSKSRFRISAVFDANYPMIVKDTLYNLVDLRGDVRLYLDGDFNIEKFTTDIIYNIKNKYAKYLDNHKVSIDVLSYDIRDPYNGKRCRVSASYLLSEVFANHINAGNFYIPMVRSNCQLTDFVKGSVTPGVDDYEHEIKELLNDARINFYESLSDNLYIRSTQNTTQISESDLLEENNSLIILTLKNIIEQDANGELYNFADSYVRDVFVASEIAKFSNWIGTYIQDLDIRFATSQYEFNHNILHLYVAVTLRGLTKQVIVEIDINKREFVGETV